METVVYGETLSAVREAALNWLVSYGPVWVSNAQNRRSIPLALWAKYSQRKTVAYEQGETEAQEQASSTASGQVERSRKRTRPVRAKRKPADFPRGRAAGLGSKGG